MKTILVTHLAVKVNQATLSVASLVTLDWIFKKILLRTITTDMLILSKKMRILSVLRTVKFLDQTHSVLLWILSKASLATRFPPKKMPMKILEISKLLTPLVKVRPTRSALVSPPASTALRTKIPLVVTTASVPTLLVTALVMILLA